MTDPEQMLIVGADVAELVRSSTVAIQALPANQSARLREIRRNYFVHYGFDEAYQRLNGRTVAQILAECSPVRTEVVDAVKRDTLDEATQGGQTR